MAVAAERAYHPIRDYLEGLPEWDGIPRVDTLLVDYFGAADNSYTSASESLQPPLICSHGSPSLASIPSRWQLKAMPFSSSSFWMG